MSTPLRPSLLLLCQFIRGAAIAVSMGLLIAGTTSAGQPPTTVLHGRVLLPDGTIRNDMTIALRAGKIVTLKSARGAKTPARRLPATAVVCPGLIDLFGTPGAAGQTAEETDAIDPDANPRDVLDPTHPDFRRALAAGITAGTVSPTMTNLVCGTCVTMRTYAPHGTADIVRDGGPLIMAIGDQVWRTDRPPTSAAGAIYELRQLIDKAHQGQAAPRVNAAVAGKADVWVACQTGSDVRSLANLLGKNQSYFGLILQNDVRDVVAIAKSTRAPVVIGPYSMAAPRRDLLGAAALADAGIEVAFRGGVPTASVDAMRMTGALAVANGMAPAAARRALTIGPAQVAGVAKRLGSIAPGKDADLVVFSNDPLRLDATVLEVFVQGKRVMVAGDRAPQPSGGLQ